MTKDLSPRACVWCGHLFAQPSPIGRMRRYCTQSCRQRAFEARRIAALIGAAVAAATESSQTIPALEAAAYPPLPWADRYSAPAAEGSLF